MPIYFEDYLDAKVDVEEGTIGGDTYTFNGKRVCYAYCSSHVRAVRTLTGGRTGNYLDIKDNEVQLLVDAGEFYIDDSNCLDQYGWLGLKVRDTEWELIGAVGARCGALAGRLTDHPGTGRCKYHGGGGLDKRVQGRLLNGKTAARMKKTVQQKIDEYMDDPQPLNLLKELAKQRAMTDIYLEATFEVGDPHEVLRAIPAIQKSIDMIGKTVERIVNIEQKYALTASQVIFVQMAVVETINRFIDDPRLREEAAQYLAERLGTAQITEERPQLYSMADRLGIG